MKTILTFFTILFFTIEICIAQLPYENNLFINLVFDKRTTLSEIAFINEWNSSQNQIVPNISFRSFKLAEIISYDIGTTIISSKTDYKYDSLGRNIQQTWYRKNPNEDSTVKPIVIFDLEYDNNNYCIRIISRSRKLNIQNSKWRAVSKINLIYNDNGQLISKKSELFDSTGQKIENSRRTSISYDFSGNITDVKYMELKNSNWVGVFCVKYSYDSNNKEIKRIYQTYKDRWITRSYKNTIYDTINNSISFSQLEANPIEFDTTYLRIEQFDSNGLNLYSVGHKFNDSLITYSDSVSYTYNENGNLVIKEAYSNFTNNNYDWFLYSRVEYLYDSLQNMIEELDMSYDKDEKTFIPLAKTTYSTNNLNSNIETIFPFLITNPKGNIITNRKEYSYHQSKQQWKFVENSEYIYSPIIKKLHSP